MHKLTTVLALALLASCSSPDAKTGDNNSTSENAATNAATSMNSSTEGVRIVLTNSSEATAYIQDGCGGPDWLALSRDDGSAVRFDAGCASCLCGVESCAVCGICADAPPHALAPGESLEFTWAGREFVSSSDEFRDFCSEESFATSGRFRARYCYGWTLEGEQGQEHLADNDCYEEAFELGVDTLAEHEITTAPEPIEPVDPLCAAADSNGFFPNCDLCGDDCDSIDAPGASGNACGCGGGCPCGLSCGSYEIAPNIVVSNICVR